MNDHRLTRRRRLFFAAFLLGAGLSAGCDSGPIPSTGAKRSPARASLAVGQPAPKFVLKDQAGKERSLDEFLGKKTVALTFHRSASW
jgi:hypothetical protein